jgi:hydrogenase maturation factor HypF (carbamoyltransferase family)
MISEEIHIRGLVQGVGFRPFVYRIAKDEGILGEVENRNDGVYILVTAPAENIDSFLSIIKDKAPPASRIDTVERRVLALRDFDDFRIVKSEIVSDSITGVSPDISTCDECLADMKSQQHRLDYPFINCTNCGPRFTIIKELPYDRENTTMDPFVMCDTCRIEYENVLDRRFHAHIASCMAENKLDGKVIGLSLDGVGLGSDGNIWGGEVLVAGYSGFERLYHFENIPIVGSDRVSTEPWRSGLAYLLKYVPDSSVIMDVADKMKVNALSLELFSKGIDLGINSHYYSSAGRLFDAVASIIGVNTISDFHAEAPMRLESVLDASEEGCYDYALERDTISFGPTIEQLVEDMLNGVSKGAISARFHRSVVNALVETVSEVSQSTGIKSVVLSGGTFQNSYLTDNLFRILKKYSYEVYLHGLVPPNDGGLALGQMAIAAHKMMD